MSFTAAVETRKRLVSRSTVRRQSIFARISTWPMVAVLIYLAAHGKFSFMGYSATYSSVDGVDGTARHVVGLLFELISAMMIFKRIPAIVNRGVHNKLILSFPMVAAFSMFWSQDPAVTFHPVLDLILNTFLSFAILDEYKSEDLLKLIEVTGFVSTVLGLLLFVANPSVGQDQVADPGALQGIFVGKNICAMQTVFLMTPLFLLRKVSAPRRFFQAIFGLVGTVALLLSRSKTGLILFVIMLVFMSLLHLIGRTRRTDRHIVLLGLGAAFLAAAVAAASNAPLLLQSIGRDVTLTGRTEIWSAVWDSIIKRPTLGYGYAAFWEALRGESLRINLTLHWVFGYAHNGYLEVWLQLGALGLVLLLVLILRTCRDGITAFWLARSTVVDWSVGIVFLSVIYNLDESFFGYHNQLPWVLFLVAALCLSEAVQRKASLHPYLRAGSP